MKTLLFAGLAGVLAMAPGTAFAAPDSVLETASMEPLVDTSFASPIALAGTVYGGAPKMGGQKMGGMRRMKMGGHRMKRMGGQRMKRMGGHRMKRMGGQRMKRMGGRNGRHVRRGRMGHGKNFRHPHRGFQLPRTFIQPSFFIGNFGQFGLSQPSYGYGWSRYYDDAVLTDRRGVVHDTVRDVDWDRYNRGYHDGYRAGQATYDRGVLLNDDRVYAHPAHNRGGTVRGGSTTYQGNWDGSYQQDGSYKGDWQGTYRGQDGRRYDGQYSGTFIGNGNAAPVANSGANYADAPHWGNRAPAPTRDYDRGYRGDDRGYRGDDRASAERCRKSSGIGGGIVGGAIGAFAGNRIAGRGNRLGGSLIGGGLGALAGGAIEQSTDRCRKLRKRQGRDRQYTRRAPQRQYAPRARYAPRQTQYAYPSGWQGGYSYPTAYYYPPQQPTVTTVVIQSQPVTTTTTTTYIEEEVIYTKPKRTYKKRWKPAPKRKWKPRRKPAPILKGCQQAHC